MATEVKFTKGPLFVGHGWNGEGYGHYRVGPENETTAVFPYDEGEGEQALADAQLYAAAPDLYEALSEAAKAFRKYEQSHNAKGSVEGAQKAAANAYLAKLCEAALSKANPSPA